MVRHKALDTFETRTDAEAWLAEERRLVATRDWRPRERRVRRDLSFEAYALSWLKGRELKPSTAGLYRGILAVADPPKYSHPAGLRVVLTPCAVGSGYRELDVVKDG